MGPASMPFSTIHPCMHFIKQWADAETARRSPDEDTYLIDRHPVAPSDLADISIQGLRV